jgi:hypothetical protein
MKKIIMLLSIMSLNLIASDGIKEQVINKAIQENISKKIYSLESIDVNKMSLSEYVSIEEESCLKQADGEIDLERICHDNSMRMYEIGDLETVIDLDIAKLTEYQSSIFVTLDTYDGIRTSNSLGRKLSYIALLPVALTADILLTPLYIFVLIAMA